MASSWTRVEHSVDNLIQGGGDPKELQKLAQVWRAGWAAAGQNRIVGQFGQYQTNVLTNPKQFQVTEADVKQMESKTGMDISCNAWAVQLNAALSNIGGCPIVLHCHSAGGAYNDTGGLNSVAPSRQIDIYLKKDLPNVLR